VLKFSRLGINTLFAVPQRILEDLTSSVRQHLNVKFTYDRIRGKEMLKEYVLLQDTERTLAFKATPLLLQIWEEQ